MLPAVAKTNAQPAARHARPAEHSKKNHEQARAHYTSAQGIHESQYNSALLASELGDFKTCFNAASEALETFPDHVNAKVIFEQLRKLFLAL